MNVRNYKKLPQSPNVEISGSTATEMESTPVSEWFRRKPFCVGNRNLIREESELQERRRQQYDDGRRICHEM